MAKNRLTWRNVKPIPPISQGIRTQQNQSKPDNSKANPALEGHIFAHHDGTEQKLQNRRQILHEPEHRQWKASHGSAKEQQWYRGDGAR
jgi:hypothetical protein